MLENTARALTFLIEKLDQYRHPFKLTVSFSKPFRSYEHDEFIEENLKSTEVKRIADRFFTLYEERYKEILSREWPFKIFIKFFVFLIALLVVIIPIGFVGFFLKKIIGVAPAFIISSVFGIILAYVVIRKSLILYFQGLCDVVSKEKDAECKKVADEVIEFSRNFFRKEKIDPRRFTMALRHNDYDGLVCERKNDGFSACLKVD